MATVPYFIFLIILSFTPIGKGGKNENDELLPLKQTHSPKLVVVVCVCVGGGGGGESVQVY